MNHHPQTASILFLGLALAGPILAQAPTYTPFGTGCPGSAGVPALDKWGGDLPRFGSTFTALLRNVPDTAFAFGILGLSNTSFGGAPLPLDLGIIGMTGCTLYTDSRRQTVLTISGGRAFWDTILPAAPGLLGLVFYQQVLVLENILGGADSATMSNAAEGVIGDLPDLIIDSAAPTVNPLMVFPGGVVTVSSWAVRNIGAVAAGGSANGWYLQQGQLPRATDVLLAQRPAGSFAPGQRTVVSARSMVIPGDTPPGDYWLGVRADHTNVVAEWTKFNNFISTRLTVLQPLPDLVISSGPPTVTPNPVFSGMTLTVPAYTIANQGFATAGNFSTGIFLSTNSTISVFDTRLNSVFLQGLAQGRTHTFASQTVTIPAGIAPGRYWIGILADWGNGVAEMDETNNSVNRLITVNDGRPDLVINPNFSVVNPVVRPFPGFPIPVQVEFIGVTNRGATASGPFRLGIHFSHDDNITTDDELMHGINIPGLAPGESFSELFLNVFIPWHVPPGVWWIGVIADDTNLVVETNEGNNIAKHHVTLF